MYKIAWCKCKIVVLVIKPIAFLKSSLPSPSAYLKAPDSFFITKLKSQFKRCFTKVVVTRAGRLREWSQGELRLYSDS